METTRTCLKCQATKQITDFHRMGKYRSSYCKRCAINYSREWARNNREKARSKTNAYKANKIQQEGDPDFFNRKAREYYKGNKEVVKARNARYLAKIKAENEKEVQTTPKICTCCQLLLAAKQFGIDRSVRGGLTRKCKSCKQKTRKNL